MAEASPGAKTGPGKARRRLRVLAFAWAALLAASTVVRLRLPSPEATPPPGTSRVELAADPADPAAAAWLTVETWPAATEGNAPPVVLLHGSPGSHADFDGLGPLLATHRAVLAPDLPGFGGSPRDVGSLGFPQQADAVRRMLDALAIGRVHLVGYSLGGPIAITLADVAPERVASLTLLSATGVQELELLGDGRLNHAVHALQLGALTTARTLVPHFGLFDRWPLDDSYARSFSESDQRPIRALLERLDGPVLVVHGRRDPLVPVAAAFEHHRLLPQSELVLRDDSHLAVFVAPETLAPPIDAFLSRVDAVGGTTRATAPAERLAAASAPYDPRSAPPLEGLGRWLVLLILAVATFTSEDLTCIAAGLLVGAGRLPFVPATLACLAGIFIGDMGLFAVGRLLGRPALRYAPLRWWLDEERLDRAAVWLRRRGPLVILLSRFTPGMRLPTYLACGLLRTPAWSFAGWFLLAAGLWTPVLVGAAAWLGAAAASAAGRHLATAGIVLLVVLVLVRVVLPAVATATGRRRLVGRWRRLTQWEFWPAWAFYPPVLLYIAWLALRHRGLTVFTAANPGIPAGGFVGESKADILRALAGSPEHLPAWELLPFPAEPEAQLEAFDAFRARHGLGWPVVLKPDAGQRGSGVAVVADRDAAARYFATARQPTIAQEHVDGAEFGVFYIRHPGEAHGRIFSITEKRLPTLVGDGRRSVAELILADHRAVAMADHYLRRQGAGAERVPAAGERVPLVDLGTHCRGAVFLDGAAYCTPELEAAIDRVSRGVAGFFFGRYDLRVPDVEALRRGGPFRILELNGVTSEATHIYDPRHGVVDAWRTLMEQWRLAFAIGAANRDAGVRPATVGELVARLRRYRADQLFHPEAPPMAAEGTVGDPAAPPQRGG